LESSQVLSEAEVSSLKSAAVRADQERLRGVITDTAINNVNPSPEDLEFLGELILSAGLPPEDQRKLTVAGALLASMVLQVIAVQEFDKS
ncbi:MAG: hypothetical protein LBE21_00005, partial [Pseudomonadales bacterium]|nr:hypothetical protein [Pseudomonadales bacterium]